MNGILLIDKPAGWTSHDVVAKLRGLLGERRIGHAGTLDPMATGLLTVFVGRSTRAVEFAESDRKRYTAGLRLGVVTDTLDTTGTILSEQDSAVSLEMLREVLPKFRGEIQQLPPMYSAIKIGGQKLYEIARKGGEVERKARSITIYELEAYAGERDYRLEVSCSKGTYIRSLCADIGEALGCGGCMSALRRTQAGAFSVDQAYTLEQVTAAEDREALLLPVDTLFSEFPEVTVDTEKTRRIRCGTAVSAEALDAGIYRVYGEDREFLMLGRQESGMLTTIKSFFEV